MSHEGSRDCITCLDYKLAHTSIHTHHEVPVRFQSSNAVSYHRTWSSSILALGVGAIEQARPGSLIRASHSRQAGDEAGQVLKRR